MKYQKALASKWVVKGGRAVALAGVALAAGSAMAAVTGLPPEADSFFADMTAYVGFVMAKFWPLALVSLGGFTVFKLVKKGVNKAT